MEPSRLFTVAELIERWRQKHADAFFERDGELLIHEKNLISALTGIPRLLTLQQFSAKHPAFPERNLRYKREARTAGYEKVLLRQREEAHARERQS